MIASCNGVGCDSSTTINKQFARLRSLRLCGSAQSFRSPTNNKGCVVKTRLSHLLTTVKNDGFVPSENALGQAPWRCACGTSSSSVRASAGWQRRLR
jgi:hypothetical protein